MTYAQEVRRKREEALKQDLKGETSNIFKWILDLIDSDTDRGYLGPVRVYLHEKQKKIYYELTNKEYEFDNTFFFKHKTSELIDVLKKDIESEDGFTVKVEPQEEIIIIEVKCH